MRTIKLAGKRVSLAPVERDDAELWRRWLNDIEVSLPLGDEVYNAVTTESMAADYEDIAKNGDPVFTIVLNETGAAIGRCLLFNVDRTNWTAMIGIFIGEKDCWSKGLGTEALELLLDYCFNLLNFHSVTLGAYSFNARAIACYQKVGFREIGRRREARIIGGSKYDIIMMDMLESEFANSRIKGLPCYPDASANC
jgi:RimJ/RimL family protein N-acetyltransferase